MEKVLDEIMPGWAENASTADTANRFIKYLKEYDQPLNLKNIFKDFKYKDVHPGVVIQVPIPFRMICEHHLLPATGSAALAYIPNNKVIGLSKLTRLVDAVGVEKPSLQEHIAHRILELMNEHLQPKGSMIVIKAKHGCMSCRGVNQPSVGTISSLVTGVFRDVPAARQEVLTLISGEL